MIGYWIGIGVAVLVALFGGLLIRRYESWTYGMGEPGRGSYILFAGCCIVGGLVTAAVVGIAAAQA
jgi:hypothetical protein